MTNLNNAIKRNWDGLFQSVNSVDLAIASRVSGQTFVGVERNDYYFKSVEKVLTRSMKRNKK